MLVGGYETLRETGQLPLGWISISLESQAYSYSSFALSLLLVRKFPLPSAPSQFVGGADDDRADSVLILL